MSLLEKLYNGGIDPNEEIVCCTPAYHALNNKINKEREYFVSHFSLEDARRFDDYECLLMESSSMYAYANFAYGFKLGTMMMCEVMNGSNKPQTQD